MMDCCLLYGGTEHYHKYDASPTRHKCQNRISFSEVCKPFQNRVSLWKIASDFQIVISVLFIGNHVNFSECGSCSGKSR